MRETERFLGSHPGPLLRRNGSSAGPAPASCFGCDCVRVWLMAPRGTAWDYRHVSAKQGHSRLSTLDGLGFLH